MAFLLGALCAFQFTAAVKPPELPRSEAALVARARAARYRQDSALARYQATARQRMSAGIGVAKGLGLGPIGRVRLAARFESVARVGWDHQLGAWGEILAARGVAPIVGEVTADPSPDDVALILPYYPGRDRLWPMTELADALPSARTWIDHPLDAGADSLYLFDLGDSLSIRLPDASVVRLRELRVRPRRPAGRLIVGSLWVDIASGALVRAAYRPSTPMDLWPFMQREFDAGDRDAVSKFGPFTGIVREIIVENGLYDGRFWLPRVRIAEGEGTAKGGRITMSIEQTFSYDRVSAVSPGFVATVTSVPAPDIDPRDGRERRPKWRGVEQRTRRCRPRGDSTNAKWSPDSLLVDDKLTVMTAEGVRFRVLLPCNIEDLATSPLLPPSIYAPSEELFTETDFNALRKDVEGALSFSKQAEWNPQPSVLYFGLDRGLLRYNRVEGLSAGLMVERVLGDGYTGAATARFGAADRQPNAELSLQRTNVRDDVQAGAFRRLETANDWGDPLGPGASLTTALFGRDDGFYYRTLGVELKGAHRPSADGAVLSWRLFGERHDSASVETQWSLAKGNGSRFTPNIAAREGLLAGAAMSLGFAWGLDPAGTRMSGNVRLEGAGGEIGYGRGSAELSVVKGLARGLQGTVMGAAGNSIGTLPPQRLWYLGGAHTVHAYDAGSLAGNAFWMGRVELAKGNPLVRPTIFADLGWAGPRTDWTRPQRHLSSAGAGIAMLDGMVRLDASRSLEGTRTWRLDLYIEAR